MTLKPLRIASCVLLAAACMTSAAHRKDAAPGLPPGPPEVPDFRASGSGPAAGRFLVATPAHGDAGFFSRTVILLLHYDELGATGLIINRPTELGVERAIPGFEKTRALDGRIFQGGPVSPHRVFALVRSANRPQDSRPVLDGLFVSESPGAVTALVTDDDPATRVRVFLGYAGWAPGQLDQEMARGSWHVQPGDPAMVFADDPATVWNLLLPHEARREVDLTESPS